MRRFDPQTPQKVQILKLEYSLTCNTIYAIMKNGNRQKIAVLQGWGFLTGSAYLNLPQIEGKHIQQQWGEALCAAWNGQTILPDTPYKPLPDDRKCNVCGTSIAGRHRATKQCSKSCRNLIYSHNRKLRRSQLLKPLPKPKAHERQKNETDRHVRWF